MAEWELPKLHTAVRFRSPALIAKASTAIPLTKGCRQNGVDKRVLTGRCRLSTPWCQHLGANTLVPTLFLSTVLAGCTPYLEAGRPPGGPGLPPPAPGVYHRVERGQTLWRIAKTYGVELEQLVAANRLADAGRLDVGEQVFIPGATGVLGIPAAGGPPTEGGVVAPPGVFGGGEDFAWPVRGRVATPFGGRTPHGPNKGLDLFAPEGTPVVAARSGQVAFVDEHLRGFGKTVIVEHGDGLSTVYTHLQAIRVARGQWVRQGEPLGTVGSTGRAPGPFLHFEVRRRHRPDNPFYYLP